MGIKVTKRIAITHSMQILNGIREAASGLPNGSARQSQARAQL